MLFKRRVVGEDANRIFINPEPLPNRFDRNGPFPVGDQPMKLCCRHLLIERKSHKIGFCKERAGLLHSGALSQDPRNKLEYSDIILSFRRRRRITSIPHEVQPCHAQPFFVDRVVIQRILLCNTSHTDNSKMVRHLRHIPKRKRLVARRYYDFFPIRKFVV